MSSQSQENSVKNSDRLLLISATYNSREKAAVLKFYDSVAQEIILWADKTSAAASANCFDWLRESYPITTPE